jgi:hypothetical protein
MFSQDTRHTFSYLSAPLNSGNVCKYFSLPSTNTSLPSTSFRAVVLFPRGWKWDSYLKDAPFRVPPGKLRFSLNSLAKFPFALDTAVYISVFGDTCFTISFHICQCWTNISTLLFSISHVTKDACSPRFVQSFIMN